MDIGNLFINLFATALIYLFVPSIFAIGARRRSLSTIKKIVIINGIVIYVFFTAINLLSGSNKAANISATFIWSYIGYVIIKKRCFWNDVELSVDRIENPILCTKSSSQKTPERYCKHCGNLIDNTTKQCIGCGKQYFKLVRVNKNFIPPIISLLMISLLLLFNIIQYKQNVECQKETQSLQKQIKTLEEDLTYLQESGNIGSFPNYTISYEVTEIVVAAQSAGGVGDVFIIPNSDLKYLMYDNNIGDTYKVNYKINGDPSVYEYNEDWYNVTLRNGETAFIWGGQNNMYVHEITQ